MATISQASDISAAQPVPMPAPSENREDRRIASQTKSSFDNLGEVFNQIRGVEGKYKLSDRFRFTWLSVKSVFTELSNEEKVQKELYDTANKVQKFVSAYISRSKDITKKGNAKFKMRLSLDEAERHPGIRQMVERDPKYLEARQQLYKNYRKWLDLSLKALGKTEALPAERELVMKTARESLFNQLFEEGEEKEINNKRLLTLLRGEFLYQQKDKSPTNHIGVDRDSVLENFIHNFDLFVKKAIEHGLGDDTENQSELKRDLFQGIYQPGDFNYLYSALETSTKAMNHCLEGKYDMPIELARNYFNQQISSLVDRAEEITPAKLKALCFSGPETRPQSVIEGKLPDAEDSKSVIAGATEEEHFAGLLSSKPIHLSEFLEDSEIEKLATTLEDIRQKKLAAEAASAEVKRKEEEINALKKQIGEKLAVLAQPRDVRIADLSKSSPEDESELKSLLGEEAASQIIEYRKREKAFEEAARACRDAIDTAYVEDDFIQGYRQILDINNKQIARLEQELKQFKEKIQCLLPQDIKLKQKEIEEQQQKSDGSRLADENIALMKKNLAWLEEELANCPYQVEWLESEINRHLEIRKNNEESIEIQKNRIIDRYILKADQVDELEQKKKIKGNELVAVSGNALVQLKTEMGIETQVDKALSEQNEVNALGEQLQTLESQREELKANVDKKTGDVSISVGDLPGINLSVVEQDESGEIQIPALRNYINPSISEAKYRNLDRLHRLAALQERKEALVGIVTSGARQMLVDSMLTAKAHGEGEGYVVMNQHEQDDIKELLAYAIHPTTDPDNDLKFLRLYSGALEELIFSADERAKLLEGVSEEDLTSLQAIRAAKYVQEAAAKAVEDTSVLPSDRVVEHVSEISERDIELLMSVPQIHCALA